MSMFGIEMMMKSLGLDPKAITDQVQAVLADVSRVELEMARQGRVIDAIAKANGINPRDFDIAPLKEIEHDAS